MPKIVFSSAYSFVLPSSNGNLARIKGFSKENFGYILELLEKGTEEFEYPPANICNADQIGISVVPNKMPQVLSFKVKK